MRPAILLFAGLLSTASIAAEIDHFSLANDLFRSGDFHNALIHFEAARRAGNESPSLLYNLGVTNYRLGRLDDAAATFSRLGQAAPEWASLAEYNLGLIAIERQQPDIARDHFTQVRHAASDERLVGLAEEALERLRPETRDIRERATAAVVESGGSFGLLNIGGGVDDNVIAFPDQQQTLVPQGEDVFTEILGYGQHYLNGNRNDGLRLQGFVYARQYQDFTDFNIQVGEAGLARVFTTGDAEWVLGAALGHTRLGGEELTSNVEASLRFTRDIGNHEWSALYRPTWFEGGSRFSGLTGIQQRLELRWRYDLADSRWTVRYRFDVNDRDNMQQGEEFFSYSPRRHALLVEADWTPVDSITLTAGAEYNDWTWDGENRLTDIDGVFKVDTRETEETAWWAEAAWRISQSWLLRSAYRYSDKVSNFQRYDYDRAEASVTLEFMW